MVHIILGTKAQFIKMAPVMKGLEAKGVSYNFVNLGQHAETVAKLMALFQVSGAGCQMTGQDVSSIVGMGKWLFRHLITIIFRPRYLRETILKDQSGIVLIHGDTLSTLIGLFMAKRAGLKVAHVESGLRSWNYFHPFPEEIIRVICMRFSDYLFAPSDEAVENLERMKVKVEVEGKRRIFNTGGNTGLDAVRAVVGGQWSDVGAYGLTPSKSYVLVSIHRFENLYSRKRFQFILDTIDEISKKFRVVFVMHGPTETRLRKTGVRGQGSGVRNITYLPLQDYPAFLQLIKNAEFIITDGGSVQEECYYLGKPCLIMRKRTERSDGIGVNGVLGRFDRDVIGEFISYYKRYERSESSSKIRPTEALIDELLMLNNSVSSVA